MVLYEYLKGRRSPATWEEEARINEAAQWLGRGYTPARRTWYDFRDRMVNQETLQNCLLLRRQVAPRELASRAVASLRSHAVSLRSMLRRIVTLALLVTLWITRIARRSLAPAAAIFINRVFSARQKNARAVRLPHAAWAATVLG